MTSCINCVIVYKLFSWTSNQDMKYSDDERSKIKCYKTELLYNKVFSPAEACLHVDKKIVLFLEERKLWFPVILNHIRTWQNSRIITFWLYHTVIISLPLLEYDFCELSIIFFMIFSQFRDQTINQILKKSPELLWMSCICTSHPQQPPTLVVCAAFTSVCWAPRCYYIIGSSAAQWSWKAWLWSVVLSTLLQCFTCSTCRNRLVPGDRFHYINGSLFCEHDRPTALINGHLSSLQTNPLLPDQKVSTPRLLSAPGRHDEGSVMVESAPQFLCGLISKSYKGQKADDFKVK